MFRNVAEKEVKLMRKVNATEMRNTVAGSYVCKTCGAWFPFKFQAGYHILFHGHKSFWKY